MNFRALVLVSLMGLGVALGGCSKQNAHQTRAPQALAVDIAKASQRDIANDIALDGQIAPLQESALGLPQSGTLVGVYVTEGERVRAGQVLAKIDDSTLRAQLAAAQAQVVQASASMQSAALTGPMTRQQTAGAVIAAEQQLLQARNALTSAQSAFETARTQFNGNQELARQGYLAKTTLEQSRSAYVAAQAQLRSAQDGVRLAASAVTTAKQNTAQTGVQAQDVAARRGGMEAAQAQVRFLQTQISQTTLSAPYDGVITQRLLDPGALASPNVPIVRISQISSVYVNANVPDDNLAYVHTGTPATFTTASLPGKTFHGTISDVNATPTQGTLSYRARIKQPNNEGLLRGGMLVSLTILKEAHKQAIVVPRSAIFQTDQGANVFSVVDGKAKEIPVQVGLQTDTLSEVRSPAVRPGTVVITTRPDALQNGSLVAIGGSPAQAGRPKR